MYDPQHIRRTIADHTTVTTPPLCPEIRLRLSTPDMPLWRADEGELARLGVPDPYWAFCWGGGQALARYLLDHGDLVADRRVLDLGSGGGVAAIAAALGGARHVCAADTDPWAAEAAIMNARLNDVVLETTTSDLLAGPTGNWDVVLAADLCYDAPLALRVVEWLAAHARRGALCLLSDLDRGFLPPADLRVLETYRAPADVDVANRHLRRGTIYRVGPDGPAGDTP